MIVDVPLQRNQVELGDGGGDGRTRKNEQEDEEEKEEQEGLGVATQDHLARSSTRHKHVAEATEPGACQSLG